MDIGLYHKIYIHEEDTLRRWAFLHGEQNPKPHGQEIITESHGAEPETSQRVLGLVKNTAHHSWVPLDNSKVDLLHLEGICSNSKG